MTTRHANGMITKLFALPMTRVQPQKHRGVGAWGHFFETAADTRWVVDNSRRLWCTEKEGSSPGLSIVIAASRSKPGARYLRHGDRTRPQV